MSQAATIDNSSFTRQIFKLNLKQQTLRLGKKTKIMGILNVTSDSFSKDGIYKDPQRAEDLALQMIKEGADIIDIGGESTHPRAELVSAEEEKMRVLPVIKRIAKKIAAPISIDTTKSLVAEAALEEGASIVNDISGLSFDKDMASVVSRFKAGCILMHIQGTPQTMQSNPSYESLLDEIIDDLRKKIATALESGIEQDKLIVDPGFGFGKTTEHNLQILKHLNKFSCLDLPILIGTSRKAFIGNTLNLEVEKRLFGTAATVALSIAGGAHIIRVHDVKEMAQVAKMIDAVLG